jgi:hypothetical protein
MPFAMTGNAAMLSQLKTQTKRQRGSKSVFGKTSRHALAPAAGNLQFQPLGSQPAEGPGSVGLRPPPPTNATRAAVSRGPAGRVEVKSVNRSLALP